MEEKEFENLMKNLLPKKSNKQLIFEMAITVGVLAFQVFMIGFVGGCGFFLSAKLF